MKKKKVWDEAARKLLFETLVARFGPLRAWQKKSTPGNGRDREYRAFLTAFAEVVGANSADAVAHQIAFARPIAKRSRYVSSQAYTAILSMAAALNAGFIDFQDVPSLIAMPHSKAVTPRGIAAPPARLSAAQGEAAHAQR